MARPSELDPVHLSPETVARYLRRHGLAARRSLSQNHLVDGAVLERIVESAAVAPGERIVEVGPGLGILTGALLGPARRSPPSRSTTALPGTCASVSPTRPASGSWPATSCDTEMASLAEAPWALVANVPYHITSPILHHVLDDEPRPARFVLMLQREVAERIAAAPGAMSYLSVFVQYHAAARSPSRVPAIAFEPAPKVDSAVLVGETRPRRLDRAAEDELWRLVQAGFRERRKMLHNVLVRQLPGLARERLEAALAACRIDPERRPQTLSVEEWLALRAALSPLPGKP